MATTLNHIVMADGVAIIMLADVMPWICSRCYCHIMLCCVVDGKPLWQIVWPCVLSKWQMLLPQVGDGITTCEWILFKF